MSKNDILKALANIGRVTKNTTFCRMCGHPSNMHKVRAGTRITHDANKVVSYPNYDCRQCGKLCRPPKGKGPWIVNNPPERPDEDFPGRKL